MQYYAVTEPAVLHGVVNGFWSFAQTTLSSLKALEFSSLEVAQKEFAASVLLVSGKLTPRNPPGNNNSCSNNNNNSSNNNNNSYNNNNNNNNNNTVTFRIAGAQVQFIR